MRKERIITLLGLLVIFVPVLGVPSTYKTVVFVTLGLAIVILSIERKTKGPEVADAPYEDIKRPEVGNDNIEA